VVRHLASGVLGSNAPAPFQKNSLKQKIYWGGRNDLDVYVKPDSENASRIMEALEEFGFGTVGLKQEDFHAPEQIIQLGVPPVRVDLITSISGVSWEEALSGSVEAKYGNVPIRILGREEFIRNKKTVGRARDLADVEAINGGND
jgi:hypothetical protein